MMATSPSSSAVSAAADVWTSLPIATYSLPGHPWLTASRRIREGRDGRRTLTRRGGLLGRRIPTGR